MKTEEAPPIPKALSILKILALISVIFLALLLLFSMLSKAEKSENLKNLSIITTNFPAYDFARTITKDVDNVDLKMLTQPGAETHDFEPTPKDIIDIENSDLFIYVGGESDAWVENLLKNLDHEKTKTLKLLDLVATKTEDASAEPDEHVWTSLKNAMTITEKIKDVIVNLDLANAETYNLNAANSIASLNRLDQDFKTLVETANRKELIFGDRFPFRYFADDYGLDYYAAFPGCSEQTEASSKTIAFLIDKIKSDHIPVVFHIELSDQKIAKTIAKETGTKILELHSAHNISKEDFAAGRTYLDIVKSNYLNLKEALK